MKTKLLICLTTVAVGASVFAQMAPSPTPPSTLQPSPPPQMQAMSQMGDMESMKRLADMCQEMMQKEEAAMPFIVGTSVIFGVLLFVALLLLVVLEIMWVIYWQRLLKMQPTARMNG